MENALNRYIIDTKTPAIHIARAAGVSGPFICDLRKNRRRPSPAVAIAIEAATGGVVLAASWLTE